MNRYNPHLRTGQPDRPRRGLSDLERVQVARSLAALACTEGRHHTETDADTGDEVCRFCRAVNPPPT